jgi:hypothetical protein
MSKENLMLETINALRKNNFEVWFAKNQNEAREIFFEEIFKPLAPKVVGWGDSLTMLGVGVLPDIRAARDIQVIEAFEEGLSWREHIQNCKKALSSDLFLTGTNAITAKGQLVNLDMVGNRVAGIAFGLRNVVIFAGVNKLVKDLDAAFERIRNHAAPLNAKRHPDMRMPCQVTGVCMDCSTPDRICNTWIIAEKSYPKGRIKIILIDEVLGL